MRKQVIKIFLSILTVVAIISSIGCKDKTPKGMSEEMYGYTNEISSEIHKFLDGKIKRSDTKDLTSIGDKMSDLLQQEYDDGSLDEKYYNDKEAATLAAQSMIYLYSEDSIDDLKDTLSQLDSLLNDK